MLMKRIKYIFVLMIGVLLLSGCGKNYKPITYTKFIENFNDSEKFYVTDDTLKYESIFERFIEVNGLNTEFTYMEFKTESEAKKYVKNNYENNSYYKYKTSGNSIVITRNQNKYVYGVQVDKIFVIGQTPNKKYKSEVNKNMSKLGF